MYKIGLITGSLSHRVQDHFVDLKGPGPLVTMSVQVAVAILAAVNSDTTSVLRPSPKAGAVGSACQWV